MMKNSRLLAAITITAPLYAAASPSNPTLDALKSCDASHLPKAPVRINKTLKIVSIHASKLKSGSTISMDFDKVPNADENLPGMVKRLTGYDFSESANTKTVGYGFDESGDTNKIMCHKGKDL